MDRTYRNQNWDEPWRIEIEAQDWFYQFYFDPDAEREAGINRPYRWLPQGKIDPYEVLYDQFRKRLSRNDITRLANELNEQSDNWRARPDEFGDEGDTLRRPDAIASSSKDNSSQENLLEEIAKLRRSLAEIRKTSASYGHNMPPEGIDDDPQLNNELDELSSVINEMEFQAKSEFPDTAKLQNAQIKLTAFAGRVMSWSGDRATKLVDSTLEATGTALGTALILKVTGILPQIFSLVTSASHFIQSIQN